MSRYISVYFIFFIKGRNLAEEERLPTNTDMKYVDFNMIGGI
jgi:hypothetical protein